MGVGLISNWDARLSALLAQLGLNERFRWTLISAHVGAAKPDPAIFRQALDLCGLPPEQVVHIGDSLDEDVRGARAAGLHAVWLNRSDGDGSSAPPGVPVIHSLRELPEICA